MLSTIFKMQRELNSVPGINRDTVGAEQSLKNGWLFQYITATTDELYELITSENSDNDKIEVIDIIHFVVSAAQIVNIHSDDIEKIFPFDNNNFRLVFNTFDRTTIINQLFVDVAAVNHQVEFKWWSKLIKENPDKQFKLIKNMELAKDAVFKLVVDTLTLAFSYGLTPIEIFEIYKKKHQVNLDRQKNDYDDRFKTEADNQQIINDLQSNPNIPNIEVDVDPTVITMIPEDLTVLGDEVLSREELFAKSNSLSLAFKVISESIENDKDYARGWLANLSMPIYDEGVDITVANNAGARLMSHLFHYDASELIAERK
jgi:hypothetical protein